MAVLIDDWNAVTENGIYMANGGANAPVSGEWHMGLVMHHNNAYSVQRVCAFASTKKWYERHQMNGSWDAWAEVAGTDFATAGIADSGGSASTGYWVKYDDRTMICYKTSTQMPIINTQAGGMYRSSYISLGGFSAGVFGLTQSYTGHIYKLQYISLVHGCIWIFQFKRWTGCTF